MSTRAIAKRAAVDAAIALDQAGAGSGLGTVTTATTNGIAQPNTQLGTTVNETTFGSTNGAGQSVTAFVPIPSGHSVDVALKIVGRVVTAGGGSAVGDSFTTAGDVGAKNVAGTVSTIPNGAGTQFSSHDASLAGVTVTFGNTGNNFEVIVTDVAGRGLIDWIIKTSTTVD